MKNKTLIILGGLFLLSSVGAGYIAPIIFLKWALFVTLIALFTLGIIRDRRSKLHLTKKTYLKAILIIFLVIISITITDIFKTKKNSRLCQGEKPEHSQYYKQNGIKNPIEFEKYIIDLHTASRFASITPDSIEYNGINYKYLTINYEPVNYTKRILIIASVHGDEPAGALAIPKFLADLEKDKNKFQKIAMTILCPMNPVGLALGSRENECGCNINRDYKVANQKETKHIMNSIKAARPNLILDLHENNGNWETCLMANTLVSNNFGELICNELQGYSIDLADYAFDLNLQIKGWHKRGAYREFINRLAGLNDLMWYGQTINIPVITVECDQSLPLDNRISITENTIKAILRNIDKL